MLWYDARTRVKSESSPWRPSDTTWESCPGVVSPNPPRAAIPGTAGELCGKDGVNSVTLCRPLLYGLHAAPLERGRRNPRKGYGRLPRARTGWHRDVELGERVPSANFGPASAIPAAVQPSRALHHLPQHCGSSGRQDTATPAVVQPPAFRQPGPQADVRMTIRQEAPMPQPTNRSWTGTGLAATFRRKQDSPGWPATPRRCTPYRHM
jgi:hypothetical protein